MSDYGFGGGGSSDPEFGGFGAGQQPAPGGAPQAPISEADFSLDFTNAEDVPDFQPIPAGPYTLLIHEAEPARASTGAAMVNLTLKVWEGEHEGRFIKDRIVMPNRDKQPADKFKKSVDFTCNTLECITGQPWKGQQRTLKPKQDLENQVVRAYVSVKPNQKDPNLFHNEIARYLPKNSAGPSGPSSSGAPAGFGGFGS